MNDPASPLSAQALFELVHKDIQWSLAHSERERTPDEEAALLCRISDLIESAREACTEIGSLPPQPLTLRARFGILLVRLVRQALFWYTPQIQAFGGDLTEALKTHVNSLEGMRRRLERSEALTAALEIEVRELRKRVPPCEY